MTLLSSKQVRCLRCGWEWLPRVPFPRRCPSCLSYKWHLPPEQDQQEEK